jgi:hypothetical protein
MSDPVLVALIAAVVALSVAYINTFVSESYRRFRDGTALAASLSGELAAYEEAWPILSKMLESVVAASAVEKPDLSFLRPFERPKDVVYEKSIEKLGLLGASAAKNVVYVYSNINAFRLAFEIIARNHGEMSREELVRRTVGCRDALLRAVTKGDALLCVLRTRASAQFKPEWPWSHWFPR